MDEDAFRSSYEAIGWALNRVNTPIIDGPAIWEMSRKEGFRETLPGLSPWEKVAEAALIIKNIDRACGLHERSAVMTYFTGGTTTETATLIYYLSRILDRDRWFVKDVVLLWARDRQGHSNEWWARKYNVNVRTIQRWSLKIRQKLDDIFSMGLSRCEDRLRESGHVV